MRFASRRIHEANVATKQIVIRSRVAATDRMIVNRIYAVRGQKVMLDRDLAELYDVPTRTLNQAVKRNRSRFPADFMFQLKAGEVRSLRSQIVISSLSHGGRRYQPFAFTQEGVAMLSAVLKSERAVQVNIHHARLCEPARNGRQLQKSRTQTRRA